MQKILFEAGFPSLVSMSEMLRTGSCTSLELTQYALDRVAALDERLHAFVDVYRENALLAARAADAMLQAGYCLGTLHGIPVALKDNIDIRSHASLAGSLALKDNIASSNAWVTTRLLESGAVIIGKTHMVEFAMGAWGSNNTMGTPRNPWDNGQHLAPGGSSSGSAVAVAAGMVPFAIGTDTGGSVRVPAALCGICGFKPTIGRLSTDGVVPLSTTHDSVGILARTAEDAAVAFDVLARDEQTRSGSACTSVVPPSLKDVRVGYLVDVDLEGLQPAVHAAYRRALEKFREEGAQLRALRFPDSFDALAAVASSIVVAESSAGIGHLAQDEALTIDSAIRTRLLNGLTFPAADYIKACRRRHALKQAFVGTYGDLDVFLTPTTPWTAKPVASLDHKNPPVRYSRVVNLFDLCGVSVPMGEDDKGLPIGLQIGGATGHDAQILRIARAFQKCTSWHLRRPEPAPIK